MKLLIPQKIQFYNILYLYIMESLFSSIKEAVTKASTMIRGNPPVVPTSSSPPVGGGRKKKKKRKTTNRRKKCRKTKSSKR